MRILRTAGLAVALAGAGLLVPATAASAATTPLTATVDCHAATGVVSARVSGTLLSPTTTPQAVTVEFKRASGVKVTATARTVLSPAAQPVVVRTTATTAGFVDASATTGTFDPASLYYREKFTVTLKNPATGATWATREGACDYDQRTTVTLTCDPVARTITAAATGINGNAGGADGSGRASTVRYMYWSVYQPTANDPGFGRNPSGWDVSHQTVRAADGSWADTGYVHTQATDAWNLREELVVGVFDSSGLQVGAGKAACVQFRNGQPVGS